MKRHSMKNPGQSPRPERRFLITAGTALLALLAAPLALAVSNVTKVEFLGTTSPNQVVIQTDGPVTYQKSEDPAGKQVIIDVQGAKLANKSVGLKLDTSSFDSKVSLVSPYQVEGQETVRVVVQMRDMAETTVTQEGNAIRLSIPGTTGAAAAAPSTPAMETADGSPAPGMDPVDEAISNEIASTSKKDKLASFSDARETKRFIGKHITLQVREAEAVDIFRLIGEASGFNIILGDDVKGKLTLSLVDVPWDLALDTVLNTLRLGAERNGNVLRISTLANLTTEKQEQLKAKKASEASAPRITRIFPISYAKPAALVAVLTKFGSALSGPVTDDNQGAMIQVDERTNSIVVRDLADNIERMKKLIELLDTQTPQILIEAKVVEASEGFSKNMSGSLGIGKVSSVVQFAGFNNGDFRNNLLGQVVNLESPQSAVFGYSSGISFLRNASLSTFLSIAEGEQRLKVVSSPKTVVLNKETAKIVQGTPVLIPGSTTTETGAIVQTNSVQQALLSLEVKPTVTNDGNVLMDLKISNDTPQALTGGTSTQAGIGNRRIDTQVVTESGATLVIGGIYSQREEKNESGIPYLRKIPVIGWLFGSETSSTTRSELFIFITPRILNEKESGISG